jgi:hypothetical protein
VKQDVDLSAHERQRVAEEYATRAVRMLVRARERGFFNFPAYLQCMKTDPDIKPLESRNDFKALLSELEHDT